MNNPSKDQLIIVVVNELKRIKSNLEQISFDPLISDENGVFNYSINLINNIVLELKKEMGDGKIKITPKEIIDLINQNVGNVDLSVDYELNKKIGDQVWEDMQNKNKNNSGDIDPFKNPDNCQVWDKDGKII